MLNDERLQTLVDECVHCGFCLPTCPTYVLWGEEMDSPRGRIYLMDMGLDGTASLNRTVVEHFDNCLGCMACLSSCPSGVRYDRLIETTRARIEIGFPRSAGDRMLRRLIFATFPHPRRLRAALRLAPLGARLPVPRSLRPLLDLAPPWRSGSGPAALTPALGERRGRVALLSGCVQSVLFGDVNAATARVLAAEGYDVVVPAQACCGALSVHAGRLAEGLERARRLVAAFERADVDLVVANAAGCGSNLKDYGALLDEDPAWRDRAAAFSARVRDVSELLAAAEPRAARTALPLRVAFQDSCHLLHAQRVRSAPRTLLASVPGLELVELPEQELCCGSAGIFNMVRPEPARQLGDRKAAHVLAAGADVYATANPGCLVQVTSALRRRGRPLPALHPIELVDAAISGTAVSAVVGQARR